MQIFLIVSDAQNGLERIFLRNEIRSGQLEA
jgi:hypothetical protein